jgi:hypothetical protein
VEGLKTLISWRIIPSSNIISKIHQSEKRENAPVSLVSSVYRKSLMLKMNKKLSVVPVSLVTHLNKIKRHRLSVTVSECTLIEDVEIFSNVPDPRVFWPPGS